MSVVLDVPVYGAYVFRPFCRVPAVFVECTRLLPVSGFSARFDVHVDGFGSFKLSVRDSKTQPPVWLAESEDLGFSFEGSGSFTFLVTEFCSLVESRAVPGRSALV